MLKVVGSFVQVERKTSTLLLLVLHIFYLLTPFKSLMNKSIFKAKYKSTKNDSKLNPINDLHIAIRLPVGGNVTPENFECSLRVRNKL